jgi:hypothetical protein
MAWLPVPLCTSDDKLRPPVWLTTARLFVPCWVTWEAFVWSAGGAAAFSAVKDRGVATADATGILPVMADPEKSRKDFVTDSCRTNASLAELAPAINIKSAATGYARMAASGS